MLPYGLLPQQTKSYNSLKSTNIFFQTKQRKNVYCQLVRFCCTKHCTISKKSNFLVQSSVMCDLSNLEVLISTMVSASFHHDRYHDLSSYIHSNAKSCLMNKEYMRSMNHSLYEGQPNSKSFSSTNYGVSDMNKSDYN
jgi:hypothetical protein